MAGVSEIRKDAQLGVIELGGEKRKLHFDLNAFAELEKRFGSVNEVMERLQEGRIGDLRVILWAGLIHDQVLEFDEDTGEPIKYGITPYEVGKWVSLDNMKEVSDILGEVLSGSLPEAEKQTIQAQVAEKIAKVGEEAKN